MTRSRGCITTGTGTTILRWGGISVWTQLDYEADSIYMHTCKVILSRELIHSVFRREDRFYSGWDIYIELMRCRRDLRLLNILKQDLY